MKTLVKSMLLVLCFTISACGPSAEQLTATAVMAQAQTQTAAPTLTPTPTSTPTPQPTATSTATPTPQNNTINKVLPEDPNAYSISGGTLTFPGTEDQINKVLENMQNMEISDHVSICPEIWVMAVPDEPSPIYAIFINSAQEDKDKVFALAIHPTSSEMEPYGVVGLGVIPADGNGKFVASIEYQPAAGQLNPDEFEIQVNFPGCEIYKETIPWP